MIGYEVVEYNNILWKRHHGALIPFHMPHVTININEHEAKKILKKEKAYFIRWEEEFDIEKNTEWWHIIKDGYYSFDSFKSKMKNKIRRGAKDYEVILCSRQYIADNAYRVYVDAFKRYNTFERILNINEFKSAILNLPEYTDFWGVFNRRDGNLVGFSENLLSDSACFYSTMWLIPQALTKKAAYTLIHEMTDYYLNKKKCLYVSDGCRNLSHETNIHEMLENSFGFRKAYSKLKIVYSPLIWKFIFFAYPFRFFIYRLSTFNIFFKISVLLEQERIRRACEKT